MSNNKNIINSASRTLARELNSIKNLKSTFNSNFCKAVNLIYNTKGKIVITGVGKSAHIGNKISATLTSTGTPSYFVHATEASHGDLGSIKKEDCVIAISNSGETSELNNIALKAVLKLSPWPKNLHIEGDSMLVIKQVTGEYAVRSESLIRLHTEVKRILEELSCKTTFQHIKREKNKIADSLANEAIDAQSSLSGQ